MPSKPKSQRRLPRALRFSEFPPSAKRGCEWDLPFDRTLESLPAGRPTAPRTTGAKNRFPSFGLLDYSSFYAMCWGAAAERVLLPDGTSSVAANAPALGEGGRAFKSPRPDHFDSSGYGEIIYSAPAAAVDDFVDGGSLGLPTLTTTWTKPVGLL